MARTYIPFYLNKENKSTLYYDYKSDQFFRSFSAKQGGLSSIITGTSGVIVYALFKDTVIGFGSANPLHIIGVSFLIGLLLGLLAIWGINFEVKKNIDKVEMVPYPSPEALLELIKGGRKWLRAGNFIILITFVSVLLVNLLLLIDPGSGVLFFGSIVAWLTLFIFLWGFRPLKRAGIYRKMKKELIRNEKELI